ncbi:pyruvate dehydrogenase E2 component (dihydrolipoamide acetyltransferase) [Labedella gwakjiensis]|uniref:Dihydrolipoamide acetyltransferase component of pyruvate dehydrogenase complex n=1 Tax=Labedella gwakjiensis TaxID=390269 RepID=A0A2P8GTD4_9MICO|nr:dihydrolipoamide acetyltransferase family protein [Labedella gwakjiensis]PSL37224.1 pyruvate dehydrogenase E2 component (dihydrolipoamide acetyltransferase) [Labedella gwakjiensis]RUQ84559.1 2-oxo acid dehydrogenase subunit E2 [Labedella gwakjiensis]
MSEQNITLPDVGEGLTEAEIVSWHVAPGDRVELNQVIVEIETAKSLVELPSPLEGVIGSVLAEEGQTVEVGAAILTVQTDANASAGPAEAPAPVSAGVQAAATPGATPVSDEVASAAADTAGTIAPSNDGEGSVLVGYGTGGHATSRRRKGLAARKPTPPASVPAASAGPVIAKPPIRKLARDLGVDLAEVEGTGLAGEITRDDVVRQASQASVFRNIETPEWGDSREERIPVRGVRKAIANAMVSSAFSAPHVSLFVDVDATRTMEFTRRLKASPDFAGVKVSPLLVMAKAMIWAVRRNPTVNATWTDDEIIVHHFVNLGFAAATPRGLLVPNVKDAQSMSLLELAKALEQKTLEARDGKTPPADMQNGTITITNIGVFGMDTGTPILNPGEVGIVALGTIKQKPWVVDGEVRPRYVTTLGASFDHRVVDGDVASRFLADVASIVEEPALLLE